MKKILEFFKEKYGSISFWLLIPILTIWSFSHHRWVDPERVIAWDVKSYYAYLPSALIYNDLSLEYARENSQKFGKWIWPVTTPTGKRCIVTSMGMSILYLPFFVIAHLIALASPAFEADGYSVPYAFCLHFSALFYLILGLFTLRKFLRFYFSEIISIIVPLCLLFGTNLLYYVVHDAALPHAYNFALFSVFLVINKKWHEKPTIKNTILIGLLAGLITLIRPTNIIILLLLIFWNVTSWQTFKTKIVFLLRKYPLILIMILGFLVAWLPQFMYWKHVSGKFLYFSYEGIGGKFFWDNPQFTNLLISFRKGWLIYTPIAAVFLAGTILLKGKYKIFLMPVLVFTLVNIYVQSSWWCWWFGGSFGQRVFVDSYGILAIPFAALLTYFIDLKFNWKAIASFSVIAFLIGFNVFQVSKYIHQGIHYWWMSRNSFTETFWKVSPTPAYWNMIPIPDYPKARQGIYVAQNLITRYQGEQNISPEMIVEEIKKDINYNEVGRGLKKRGRELGLAPDSLITIEAWNIYETKWNLKRYILPLEDSLNALPKIPSDSLSLGPEK